MLHATTIGPEVTRTGVLDMQVCVPADYTDEQIEQFANTANPAGITPGWKIRREGSKYLAGAPERQPCSDRAGCIHVMLDC